MRTTSPARRRFIVFGTVVALLALLTLALVPPVGAAGDPAPRLEAAQEGEPGVRVDAQRAAERNGVTAFGSAGDFGPDGDLTLASPVLDIVPTRSGNGYWTVAGDGGVFSFGDARFFGSTGGMRLNEPVVGMAATRSGNGYWLVARDGGVFSFGDAVFRGSTGGISLNQPVVDLAPTTDGRGYWMVGGDGGVFAFGGAPFLGSLGGRAPEHPIVGMAAAGDGDGYWIAARDGQVYEFGPPNYGSIDGYDTDDGLAPTVAIAARGADGYWLAHGERDPLDRTARGPAVAGLQERLRSLGYWVGPVDGLYGELTEQAVYAFQKVEGLEVTGVVDTRTRTRLDAAARPRPRATAGDGLEVDKTRQLVFVVRNGRTEWVFHTSTGNEEFYFHEGERRFASTPNGRYEVFRQIDGVRVAPLGRLYRPKYFTTSGIALHGYTSVPTEPASHGCVRVSNAAIDFIWARGLVPIGTDVWVYGQNPG